jgi:hypothetical protein
MADIEPSGPTRAADVEREWPSPTTRLSCSQFSDLQPKGSSASLMSQIASLMSLHTKKLRDLELKAGYKAERGQKGAAHAYNIKSHRDQERRWVEQALLFAARSPVRERKIAQIQQENTCRSHQWSRDAWA